VAHPGICFVFRRTNWHDQPRSLVRCNYGAGGVSVNKLPSDERWSLGRADSISEADLEQHFGIGGTLKGRKVLGLLTKHPSEAR
jgi:hypothetical protein